MCKLMERPLTSLAMPQTIAVDDFTMQAELPESDSGLPPILLVHGLFVGPWEFERVLPALAARGFAAYAVALSGREGGRPVEDVGSLPLTDFADDARDALAWIARKHRQTPILLGHSMGGLIAQMVAASSEVAALVLISPAPPRGIPLINLRLLFKQLRNMPRILAGKTIEGSPEEMAEITLNRVPAGERPALYPRFIPDSGRAAREISFGAVAVDEDRVRAPVLAITGDDDRLIPPGVTRRIAARYHAPVWEYKDQGHFLVFEPGIEKIVEDLSLWLRHVALQREHASQVEELWTSLQASIGDVVDLTFFDGRVARVEMVNVDLAQRRNVVYRMIELKRPGRSPSAVPAAGDVTRAALHELAAVTPAT